MKTLTIHMGAHKTASTLIQQNMKQQIDQLQVNGVTYQADESYALGVELMQNSPLTPERLGALSRHLDETKNDNILWSCEGFCGNFYEHYANQDHVLKDLATITKGVQVQWVLYVRRQDTFAQSLYQQMVKEGQSPSWNDYLHSMKHHPYDWNRICERIANYFSDSRYHVFPYEMIHDDASATTHALCDVLNIDIPIEATAVVNPSLSSLGIKLARCAPYLPKGKIRYVYRRLLQAAFPKHVKSGHALLSDGEHAELLASYADSNRQLFDRWITDQTWRDYYVGAS